VLRTAERLRGDLGADRALADRLAASRERIRSANSSWLGLTAEPAREHAEDLFHVAARHLRRGQQRRTVERAGYECSSTETPACSRRSP